MCADNVVGGDPSAFEMGVATMSARARAPDEHAWHRARTVRCWRVGLVSRTGLGRGPPSGGVGPLVPARAGGMGRDCWSPGCHNLRVETGARADVALGERRWDRNAPDLHKVSRTPTIPSPTRVPAP